MKYLDKTGLTYLWSKIKSKIPTKTSDLTNDSSFITGITSSDVTTALGYTPYNSTNPNGYTSNTGTITKVQANGTDVASSGTANIPAATTSSYGVTKLSSATNSTSTVLAATSSAVKDAYDLATAASGRAFDCEGNIGDMDDLIGGITLVDAINARQEVLTSGENIKTIDNRSLLGSGNLDITVNSYSTSTTEPYSASYINSLIRYSETTEYQVGIWVNDKPIYRKTFYVSSLPNNNFVNVAHNIANIDVITDIQGIMRTPSNGTTVPINFAGTSALYGSGNALTVRADRTNLVIGDTTNWTANEAYIHLYYTKTTD